MKKQGVMSKLGRVTAVCLVTGVLAFSPIMNNYSFARAAMLESSTLGNNGKFYTDYTNADEAKAAAAELNTELAPDGQVLF